MKISRREFSVLASSALAAVTAPKALGHVLRIRPNVNSLDAARIRVFRDGVGAMASLPVEDFRSRVYQANVHMAPFGWEKMWGHIPDTDIYWNQCLHDDILFLPWHRWYLYFIEQIIRELSGDPGFNLPYWDSVSNGFLPEAVRVPADATNSLYDGTRNTALNDGTGQVSGLNLDAMNAHSFLGFAWLGIELNPHNPVHGSVGGNLGPVRTAGLDPLFYLHHANIDRYWECWLRKDDRNENISSSETFHFQSLSGPQTVSVNSALRTEDLGYTYDVCPGEWRFRIPGLRYLFFIDRRYLLRPFPDPPAPWERFVLLSESFGMNASDSAFVLPRKELELGKFDGSRPHAILLRDVEESKLASEGGFFLEAWLAPDAAQLPKVGLQDAVRIGTLGKFELSGHDMHAKGEHQHLPGVKFKLSPDALKRLDGKADPAVVFVRHGIVDKEGKPFDYDPKALLYKVGALALVAQKS